MKKRRIAFTPEFLTRVRAMAETGMQWKEIARIEGREYKSLWLVMNRHKMPGKRYVFPSGEDNPSWNDGRYVDNDGYIHISKPDHPHTHGKGFVLEHRLVMEKEIGRFLKRDEVVHHKDGCRSNNAIENLQLFDKNGDHLRHELTGRCPRWTDDGKRRILEAVKRKRPKHKEAS